MDNQNQEQDLSPPQPTSLLRKLSSIPTKYIIIFLTILIILSFGSTSYLLVANKKKAPIAKTVQENTVEFLPPTLAPTKVASKPTIIPTPTLAVVVDPIATWSAFVSTKYAYSIKYPPDWAAKITTQTDPKILEYVVFNPKNATISGTLFITLSYGTRTYQEALALDPQKGETITVASISATKKNQKDSGGNPSINVIIPTGVNTIIINAKEKYRNILDKMLTTVNLAK